MTETTLQNVSLDIHQLNEARQKALKQGVSVMQVLEEGDGETAAVLIAALGKLLHLPVLSMETIHTLVPAFEVLPFF